MSEALTQLTTTLFGAEGAITTVFEWMTSATVLPFFAIGIGISLSLFGVGSTLGATVEESAV